MEDIKIDTIFWKIQYVISWVGFILAGFVIVWLIAIGLASYGKDTRENKDKKKWLLNTSAQKFIFTYGSIAGDLLIVATIIGIILSII